MKILNLVVTEDYFEFQWWAPRTWSKDRRRYWEIVIRGYGVTQAIRKEDISVMACEYAALQDDKQPSDYQVGSIQWY